MFFQTYRPILLSILAAWASGAWTGCTLVALQENVEIYEQTVRLSGRLHNPSPRRKPVIVLLYQVTNNQKRLKNYLIYHTPDRFQFRILPGRYTLEAFEDANRDLTFQPSEYATNHGTPSNITIEPGQDQLNVDLVLQPPESNPFKQSQQLVPSILNNAVPLTAMDLGEIVSLNDARFTVEKAHVGLWEPIRSLNEKGGGLYFLEPFDPHKIPIIFIHGAGGSPREWAYLIQQLEKKTFQAWIFQYPSGLYLDDSTELLRHAMSKIFLTYHIPRLILVSHSMGGLVARAALNLAIQKGRGQDMSMLLITISTPWGGHQGAQMAVDYSTTGIIPSWVDMVPGSPFQKKLFEIHLPENIQHYLFFGFKGGLNPFTEGNDDGAVSLASQLKKEAQESATEIWGFNEDHGSILQSPDVADKLQEIFANFSEID